MRDRHLRSASLAGAALLALTSAPAAIAHSTLLRTEPAPGAVTEHGLDRVVLTFDEPVEAVPGSLRVHDGSGGRVDQGSVQQPGTHRVAVAVDRPLRRGTYTVTWRVVSADSDPVSGAYVFHVRRAGPHPGGIAAEVLEDTPASVTFAYDVARFFEYATLLLCAGGALMLAVVLRPAAAAVRRRLYEAIAGLALVLAAVSLLELPLQGAASGGIPLREAFRGQVVEAVAQTRFGEVALARAGIAALLAAVAFAAARRGGRELAIAAVVLAASALATPVAVSHANASGRLATLADASHIAAASAWVGGLAFVTAALLLARRRRWRLAGDAVPRFSKVAVASVAVLLLGGVLNGYLQVRSWSALWETTYGRLLLAKLALLAPLLGLGAFNNRYALPRLRAAVASAAERRRFLRAVGAELALMTSIVAITALLVSAPPARTQHTSPRAHRGQAQIGPYAASVRVVPAIAGANRVSIDFAHAEVPVDVHISATLERENVGPLRTMLRRTTHSSFTATDVPFPIPGAWSLRIEARRNRSELYTQTVTVRIAPAR